jgi:hypothetical protein
MKVPNQPIAPVNETMALGQITHELREIKEQLVQLNAALMRLVTKN